MFNVEVKITCRQDCEVEVTVATRAALVFVTKEEKRLQRELLCFFFVFFLGLDLMCVLSAVDRETCWQ